MAEEGLLGDAPSAASANVEDGGVWASLEELGANLPDEDPPVGGPRTDYRTAEPSANKLYAPIRNRLLRLGYRLAERFGFILPGGRALYYEDRFELQGGIQPSGERPAKARRFWHDVNGTAYSNTGPRDERIIYGWQAIIDAGPGATVHVTEGARKAQALIVKGVLATAVAYHSWNERCVNALRGCHIIYHQDHDLPDANGTRAAEKLSADARTKLAPVAVSFRILPARRLWDDLGRGGEPPHGWDVKDWLDAGRTAVRLEEICRELKPYSRKLPIAPIREWDDKPAPAIEYGVNERFPLEAVSLFSGEGGSGKSTSTHQLAVAHTLEREWLGITPRKGPAIYVECEDSEKVLHWRQKRIAEHYGVTQAAIADAGFVMIPLTDAEEGAILATAPDKSGIVHPTPLYKLLYEMAGDIKPVMIGIASAAIVFAGNENVRPEVQQFMWLLRRLTHVSGGYVLLVAQPSLTGIGDTSISHAGLSGTTQWHNGSRARAVLRTVKAEGSDADTGLREIKFYKNQYGPLSASCFVRYTSGLFLPVEGMSMNAAARAVKVEEIFILLLKKFTAQRQTVNHLAGRSYAPARFIEQPEAIGIDKKEFKGAMQRLLDSETIEIREIGKPSRLSYRLAMKDD
jgi:RecA-family ATPase